MTQNVQRIVGDWIEEAERRLDLDALRKSSGSAPALIVENEVLREESIRYTVQLLVAERCSRAAAAGLLNAMPSESGKQRLAVQVIDEARHVEVFTNRILRLGVSEQELDDTILRFAHPDLLGIADVILEQVREGDHIVGVVAQNIIFDEALSTVYRMLESTTSQIDPAFSCELRSIIEDESKHIGFGESELRELIVRHPEKKVEIARVYREIGGLLLKTLEEALLDNPMVEEFRRLRAGRRAGGDKPMAWCGIDMIETGTEPFERALITQISERVEGTLGHLGVDVTHLRNGSPGR